MRARTLEAIKPLRRFPGIGTPTDDRGTRMLVATHPYLVFYEIDHDAREVVILHIRHGARDRNG